MAENENGPPSEEGLDAEWAAAMEEQRRATQNRTDESGAEKIFPTMKSGLVEGRNDIDMIADIPVQLTVELGRTRIPIRNILQLAQGSVIELEALAGEPMDVLVNGCLIAQGEVVVVNEKFGIRLTDVVTPAERMRRLNRT
jgi:flagellar motor switch protein FliN/FliY